MRTQQLLLIKVGWWADMNRYYQYLAKYFRPGVGGEGTLRAVRVRGANTYVRSTSGATIQ